MKLLTASLSALLLLAADGERYGRLADFCARNGLPVEQHFFESSARALENN